MQSVITKNILSYEVYKQKSYLPQLPHEKRHVSLTFPTGGMSAQKSSPPISIQSLLHIVVEAIL